MKTKYYRKVVKYVIGGAFFVLLVPLLFSTPPQGSAPWTYEVAFSDLFDGGQLDSSKWEESSYIDTFRQTLYSPSYSFLSNGFLYVKVQDIPGADYLVRSGRVTSKFNLGYGYYELRSQLPSKSGYHVSFWAWADSPGQEIDIFEVKTSDYSHSMTLHENKDNFPRGFNTLGSRRTDLGFDHSEGFHTYSALWNPYQVYFYVDDKLYNVVNFPASGNNNLNAVIINAVYDITGDSLDSGAGYYKTDYFKFWSKDWDAERYSPLLKVHYSLDNHFLDTSDYKNDAAPIGSSTTTNTAGIRGDGAVRFDGGGYRVAKPSGFWSSFSKLTVAGWIKNELSDTAFGGIIQLNGNGGDKAFGVSVKGTQLAFDVVGWGDRLWSSPSALPYDDKWHHVTCVYDGTLPYNLRSKIYIDGILDATGREGSSTIPGTKSNMTLGSFGSNHLFVGSLDDIRVYAGKALSERDIVSMADPSCQTLLTFEDSYGITADDLTGENNNASISNCGWDTRIKKFGKSSMFFPGEGLNVSYPIFTKIEDDPSLDDTSELTMMMWVNLNDSKDHDFLMYKDGAYGLLRHNLDGKLKVRIFSDPTTYDEYTTESSFSPHFDKWTHIAVVYNRNSSTRIKLYINGVIEGLNEPSSPTTLAKLRNSDDLLVIGQKKLSAGSSILGHVDDVKIYRRALGRIEIVTAAGL